MKRLKGILVLALLLALLASPLVVLASDISGARYYGTIIVSNNSTATTNVAVNCTISTQALIDGGYLSTSANNCVIRSSAGADLPFMPAANATYPWCIWVPSIGSNASTADILYTANSTGGKIRYFPAAGGMETTDSPSLELGDNFTIEQRGWVDTFYSANKTLIYKEDAFVTYIASAENITSAIPGVWSANLTETLHVDAAGSYTNISDVAGAATHWEAVQDDPATDTQYVFEDTGPNNKWDSYSLEDTTAISVYDSIDQVEVYVRGKIAAGPGTSTFSGGLRLGAVEADMPSSFNDAAWTTHNEVVARPGGGTWTLQNIQDLEVRVNSDHTDVNDPRDPYISQVYIIVTYRNPTMVSTTGVSNGEHAVLTEANGLFFGIGADQTTSDSWPLIDNLVLNTPLYHRGLDGSPFTTKDVNEHTCTVTGATWSSDLGRTFDGTNDDISCGNDNTLDFTSENFTLEAWVRLSELTSGKCVVIRGVENVSGYTFRIPSNERLWLDIKDAGGRRINYTAIDQVVADTWYHLVVVRDGTLAIFYRNGVALPLELATAIGNPVSNANNFIIGDEAGPAFDWAGDIGEVRAYDRALTPDEVLANYNATKWKYDGSDDYSEYNLVGTGVPNTATNWSYYINMDDYWEYTDISVNGTQVQYIDWEYDDTTFQDSSAFDNDATPTFRTGTSDPDVTAVLTSFLPVAEARAPAYVLEDAPAFIDEARLTADVVGGTGEFTTTPPVAPAGAAEGFPLAGVITAVADATNTPAQLPLLIVAGLIIIALSLSVSATLRKYGSGSLIVKVIAITAMMGVFIGMGNFGVQFWMLFVFLIIATALMMGSRHTTWQ